MNIRQSLDLGELMRHKIYSASGSVDDFIDEVEDRIDDLQSGDVESSSDIYSDEILDLDDFEEFTNIAEYICESIDQGSIGPSDGVFQLEEASRALNSKGLDLFDGPVYANEDSILIENQNTWYAYANGHINEV